MAKELDIQHLYDAHAQALFAFLMNLTRDEAETRDLLQELFLRVVRKPGPIARARNPRSFLLAWAHHLTIDRWRQRAARECRESEISGRDLDLFQPAVDPDRRTFQDKVAAALATLPTDQRAVFHLKMWEGLTFEAIGQALNIPANTAASRYRYALDKLRHQLRPLYEEIR
jgi:RNA polymerase sigma-70 factor, ECF subfamily